jgi:transketolase
MEQKLNLKAKESRSLILNVAKRVGGSHIGGAFSIIDFLCSYYFSIIESGLINKEQLYSGNFLNVPQLIFSKGHCYLAQLAALDVICEKTFYTDNYLVKGSNFFGHPKQDVDNENFPVSTGALGQGITFGNGLSLSNKLNKYNDRKVISIIGDGELNEGSCIEALLFASHHNLNHTFILDNNNQMSLGKTTNIFSLGNLNDRFLAYGLECNEINGHNFSELVSCVSSILNFNNKRPQIFILNTIKGRGVSFMESDSKWHHRRFKEGEFEKSIEELK